LLKPRKLDDELGTTVAVKCAEGRRGPARLRGPSEGPEKEHVPNQVFLVWVHEEIGGVDNKRRISGVRCGN